jgi:hypothetical protein
VPVNLLLLLGGAAVVLLVFHDAWVTTVSGSTAAGPITQRLGTAIWWALRRFVSSPRSSVLAAAGPVIVFCMLLVWLLGLWSGWSLVFAADPGAVTHEATGQPADWWSRVYFAGYAVYTLGMGDLTPDGAPWQVLTALATINGFVLLTMSVSYLIPVVMAVSERNQHGIVLHGLVPTAQELLLRAWDGRSLETLHPNLRELAPMVARAAQKYLSYPVLHFFHSPERTSAFEPGLAALDEALLLLEHGVEESLRPPPLVLTPLRASLDRFAEVVAGEFVSVTGHEPPAPSLEPLRRAGIPTVDDATFGARVTVRREHRRVMGALLEDARWPWEQAVLLESEHP